MIFVTVGSMLPFDRLIRAMDSWAADHAAEDVFAQIGDGHYLPRNMKFDRLVAPAKFREIFAQASVVVAHAGMGSVISAAELGRPIVLLPRLAAWKEHTTDHQRDTAHWLRDRPGVLIADSEDDLQQRIEEARGMDGIGQRLSKTAPADFVVKLRQAIAW